MTSSSKASAAPTQPVQAQIAPPHQGRLCDEDEHPCIEDGTVDAEEYHEPMRALGMDEGITHRAAEAISDHRQHE
jgi:hypothetical protein